MLIPIQIGTGKQVVKKKKVSTVTPEEQAKAFDILRKQTSKDIAYEEKKQAELEANLRKRTVDPATNRMVFGEAPAEMVGLPAPQAPKVAPTPKVTKEGLVKKTITTKFGDIDYTATPEESQIFRSGDINAINNLMREIALDFEKGGEEQGLKPKTTTTEKYTFDTVDAGLQDNFVAKKTKEILNQTFKALMPAPMRAISDIAESAGQGLQKKGQELMQSDSSLGKIGGFLTTAAGGILEDASNPLATFTAGTGNLYDPNATAEERIGAVGNIVGYALGAMNPLEAAGAGIKAFRAGATGTEALTTAGRSLLRSSVPLGTKIDTALANKASLKNLIDVLEAEGQMMGKTRAALTKEFVDAGKTFAKETGKTAEEFYTKYLNDFAEGKGQLTTPSPTAPAAFELPSVKAPEGVPEVSTIPEPAISSDQMVAEKDYRMTHRAPSSGNDFNKPLSNLSGLYPDDIYTNPKAYDWYGSYHPDDKKTVELIKKVKDNPNAEVTIYRAVPKGVTDINDGDWVTLSKKYAIEHGESNLNGEYDILQKKVKAGDVYSEGNSLNEWGYSPEPAPTAIPEPTAPVVEPPTSVIPEPPVATAPTVAPAPAVEPPTSVIPEPTVAPAVEPTPTIEPPTTEVIPPVEPTAVKTDIPDVQPTEDLTSFAKRVTGRDPMEGTNARKIMDGARKFVQDGKINVENLVKNLIDNRTPVNEVESGAILDELAKLKAQQKVIEREAKGSVQDVEEWNRLQGQIERYQQAGDIIGNQFHRLGMALQVAIKEDMSVGSIMRKAKVLNLGDDVSSAMKAKLEDLGQRYEKAVAELEKLKNKGSEIVDAVKRYEGTERFAVKTRERAASVAKNWFEGRDLGGGGFGSRKRGAVTYTIPDDELKARSAVRKLAKEAALDGAETLDAVLDDIRARIGVNVKDEDLLAMIYEPYSKYKIESDLARIKSNQALNDVKRAAEFRSKSALGKFSSVFLGTLNGTARAMQAGADFSAPLIQGRKGVFANPIGWLKAYAPMFKAATGKRAQEVALRELAKIEQHPLYGKAKAAGLQLTEPGGTYSRQEENFMTNMDLLLETLEKNKGAKRAVGLPLEGYLNVMVRSEDAFTTYMNALRYDTFVKMAKAAPNDPEYLKDVADIINVIYGRGTGKVAQAAGQIGGELAFAPRYLVSNIQYQSGVPFFKARTAKGKMQAARIYATHAIAMKSLMGLAALAGWKVNTDMRSSKGGSISDGTDTFDLYGKDTQIIRLLTQMAYGKINTKGEYKPPSNMQAATLLGQFGQGKFAPFPRLLSESIFGTFDEEYGGTRPLNKEDYVKKALPLWVGQYLKDADKYGGDAKRQARNTIMQLFGEEVTPELSENPQTPFDITKPGIQQEFAGMADLPPKL
jgi:hypothetical protein